MEPSSDSTPDQETSPRSLNCIRLLQEQVANQIAAGEVIERPASIVKELVENALDAHATQINIEIHRGGRQLVRVEDNGIGMSRDDALLCLERHATSKIRSAEDLTSISTMGFRGEALPSIASVSRFSLTTCPRDIDSPEATQLLVQGGKLTDVRAVGHPPGTTVEVRQLFHNLPARRKFLRSEETERSHIQHYLTLAALAYPHVGFTLRQEGRVLWRLPALPTGLDPAAVLGDRLRAVLGTDLPLLPLDTTQALPSRTAAPDDGLQEPGHAPQPSLRIWGYLGAPGTSRATRQDQHLFVNRRPVQNRGLNFALLEGYHNALMKGRYPIACLFLEIDPADVDVNVHPAKREVRFHHEWAVRTAVATAVRDALQAYHANTNRASSSSAAPPETAESPAANADPSPSAPTPVSAAPSPARSPSTWLPDLEPPTQASLPSAPTTPHPPAGDALLAPAPAQPEPPPPPSQPAAPSEQSAEGRPLLEVPLRLVGVVARLYVVLESDRGLVLMDQHAAHERVLYEQMLQRLEQGEAPSQRLLLPETVELSIRDAQFVREHLPALTRLGVGLSEFGDRTFLLDALPPFVRVTDAKQYVTDVIDGLKSAGREVNKLRLGEDVVAKTVCRHAVKANDLLATEELEKLLQDLRHCVMPYTCPHGRPTLIEFNTKELERKFGRVT